MCQKFSYFSENASISEKLLFWFYFGVIGRRTEREWWSKIWTSKRTATCFDRSGSFQKWSACQVGCRFGRDKKIYGSCKLSFISYSVFFL